MHSPNPTEHVDTTLRFGLHAARNSSSTRSLLCGCMIQTPWTSGLARCLSTHSREGSESSGLRMRSKPDDSRISEASGPIGRVLRVSWASMKKTWPDVHEQGRHVGCWPQRGRICCCAVDNVEHLDATVVEGRCRESGNRTAFPAIGGPACQGGTSHFGTMYFLHQPKSHLRYSVHSRVGTQVYGSGPSSEHLQFLDRTSPLSWPGERHPNRRSTCRIQANPDGLLLFPHPHDDGVGLMALTMPAALRARSDAGDMAHHL